MSVEMLVCPECGRCYRNDEASFCASDGKHLLPAAEVPLNSDPTDGFIGATIAGKYELRRIVADGGMGRVYEGRQLDVPRRVALKVLHSDVAQDPVNIERFKREAETSQALDHTYIVNVFDFAQEVPAPGRPEGAWFLVMEYLDGEELRAVLKRDKVLPLARVIRLLSQAAIALDGAHQRGLVHRDLKPENLFLVRGHDGDTVKVLDFGSVKFTKGQDKGQKLTVMGTTIGSPFYMSPEQAKGAQDLDQRTDVWALGTILYETVIGKVPFHAAGGPQILFKILGEEPMPPSMAKDDAPHELDEIIVRALAKRRDARYASCGELADALVKAFGVASDHLAAAAMPEKAIAAKIAEHQGGGGSSLATEPTGRMDPAPIAQPAPPQAGPSSPRVTAATTDDDASFDAIAKPKAPIGLIVGGIVAVLALGAVAFFAMR